MDKLPSNHMEGTVGLPKFESCSKERNAQQNGLHQSGGGQHGARLRFQLGHSDNGVQSISFTSAGLGPTFGCCSNPGVTSLHRGTLAGSKTPWRAWPYPWR